MLLKYLKKLLISGVILIVWFLASHHPKMNPLFLPKPEIVWSDLVTLTQNGMLQQGMLASFGRITVATLITSMITLPLGLLVVNHAWLNRMLTPVTAAARYIPITIASPLLMLWLGIGEPMKIAFLTLATMFFFLPTVVMTVKETSQELIDTAYTIGMSPTQVMLQVLLPNSLPVICESFLMMYGIGWNYVILVETFNATSGLGYIINLGSIRGRTDLVFAALGVILLISIIFDKTGKYLIKKAFPWKYARAVED